LSNLPRLHRLQTLLLSSNRISHIAPTIAVSAPRLKTIVLTNNAVTELADLSPLGTLKYLEFLSLLGNPVREKKNYREWVIWKCSPSLRVLDFQRIKDKVSCFPNKHKPPIHIIFNNRNENLPNLFS
jgi:U2 small nuclear ribonucleoprotein A'